MKIIEGKYLTSLHEIPVYNFDVLKLSRRDRQYYENSTFSKLQNINKTNLDYLISGVWIQEWIKFAHKNNDLKEPPPG